MLPAPEGERGASELRARLVARDWQEVITFSFVAASDERAIDPDARPIAVLNPIAEHLEAMRTTLLPGLLKTLARNVGRGLGDLALFEQAPVYLPRPEAGPAAILGVDRRPTDEEWTELLAAVPEQPLHAAVVLTGDREASGWWGPGRQASWADALEAVPA